MPISADDFLISQKHKMRISAAALLIAGILSACTSLAQGDNEIQVYASPTIGEKKTIVELHNNYTFKGSKNLVDPRSARWLNHTLEITHGIAANVEIGFYTFVTLSPDGRYQYLGNQIRPRVTAPDTWNLPFGISFSASISVSLPHNIPSCKVVKALQSRLQ